MKIIIENFGPIYKYEFDLQKDFHIIYGKNNIGKSYAISAVYLILKAFKELREELLNTFFNSLDYTTHNEFKKYKQSFFIEKIIKNIFKKAKNKLKDLNNTSFSIKSDSEKILKAILEQSFIKKIQEVFQNSFSSIKNIPNRFSKEEFQITFTFQNFFFTIKINEENNFIISNIKIAKKTIVKFVDTNRNVLNNGKELRFYVNKNNKLDKMFSSLEEDIINHYLEYLLLNFYTETLNYNDIYFLPASKSGLYEAMNIFSSVFAKLSQMRHLIRGSIEIPALSVPMSDYFLHLSTIKTSDNNDIYNALAREIEESILDAEIIFNDDSKKLEYYSKKTQLRLELSETSSMISEVAPIVAYLKYIINENDRYGNRDILRWLLGIPIEQEMPKAAKILFIEEPEAHLHPEVQLKLMNIFAKLIQHDVKIVMTTHSNYIFNKTNNLIYSKEMDFNKISNNHFINTEKGSIVSQAEITPTEIGMEDENFVNVTEQLYNERLSLND